MIDNEIIKALECCKKDDCDNCPNDFGNCYANLSGYSLDIINRQQAEIERLRKEANLVSIQFQDMQERYEEAQAEIERLNNIKFGVDLSIGSIKTEAIKEFAERLKENADTETYYDFYDGKRYEYRISTVDVDDIDNLVKEYEKGGEKNDN